MAARAKVIEAGREDPSHPCFAKGSKLKYSYADKEYAVQEVVDAGDFKKCTAVAFRALEHDKDCGQPKVGGPVGCRHMIPGITLDVIVDVWPCAVGCAYAWL